MFRKFLVQAFYSKRVSALLGTTRSHERTLPSNLLSVFNSFLSLISSVSELIICCSEGVGEGGFAGDGGAVFDSVACIK